MKYDVWFISYYEPNAEANWRRARGLVPGMRRLNGVEGLVRAYRIAALHSSTEWFWIIDGDNWLLDPSIFEFEPPPSAGEDHLFVWPARNSVNGLRYGNGGIKLYHRRTALNVHGTVEDFSIAVCRRRVKFDAVASETRINGSPLQAWISGFREGFKLHRRIRDGESNACSQLDAWMCRGREVIYGEYAISGSELGHARFGLDPTFPINDRSRLEAVFHDSVVAALRAGNPERAAVASPFRSTSPRPPAPPQWKPRVGALRSPDDAPASSRRS